MPHTPNIPDIPGEIVLQPYLDGLRRTVAKHCQANNTK